MGAGLTRPLASHLVAFLSQDDASDDASHVRGVLLVRLEALTDVTIRGRVDDLHFIELGQRPGRRFTTVARRLGAGPPCLAASAGCNRATPPCRGRAERIRTAPSRSAPRGHERGRIRRQASIVETSLVEDNGEPFPRQASRPTALMGRSDGHGRHRAGRRAEHPGRFPRPAPSVGASGARRSSGPIVAATAIGTA
jgi:hypothetical protein